MPEYFKNAPNTVAYGAGKLCHSTNAWQCPSAPPLAEGAHPPLWPAPAHALQNTMSRGRGAQTQSAGQEQVYFEPAWNRCPSCKAPGGNASFGTTYCISETMPADEDHRTYLKTVQHLEAAKNASNSFTWDAVPPTPRPVHHARGFVRALRVA